MDHLKIIMDSYSIGDASDKIFGYTNKITTNYILEILDLNNLSKNIFIGKNKNRKYSILNKECPICKKLFITKNDENEKTTCSISCSNSFKPKRKKQINKNKNKNKNKKGSNKSNKIYKKKCEICNIDFIGYKKSKTCSKKCGNISISNSIKKRVKEGTHIGWKKRNIESYPEKYFKDVLLNNKIDFCFNKPIQKKILGIDDVSCYFLDFYIEVGDRRIDLEIDGKQHNLKDRAISDAKRDKLLINYGMEVYRIKWKNPINENNKKYLYDQIEDFIRYYNGV